MLVLTHQWVGSCDAHLFEVKQDVGEVLLWRKGLHILLLCKEMHI